MTFTKKSPAQELEKLLILGCGDLGERLAGALATKPYKITGVRRRPMPAASNLSYRALDLHQTEQLRQLLAEGWDTLVISLSPDERSDQGYKRTYVDTAKALMDALQTQAYKPRLLLFVSSTSVYSQEDGSWVNEDSLAEPKGFNGKRLLEAEEIIASSDLNHVIVRFSGIYGPGRERLINQVKSGSAPLGNQFTNRIHAQDCARVLAHLIERQRSSPLQKLYLASDSYPCTQGEIAAWLGTALGLKTQPSGNMGQPSGKRIHNQRLLHSGFQLSYADFRLGYAELLEQPSNQDQTQA